MSDEARPTIPGAFRARTTGSIADPPGPLHARRGGALPPLTVTKSFPTQLPEKRNAQEPPPAPATPNKAPRLAPPLQPLQGPTVIPRPNPPPYVAPPPPSAPFPVFEDARPQSWTTARPGPINRAPNRPPPVAQHTAVPGEEFDELAFCSTQYLVATSPAKKSSQSPVKSRLPEQNFWGLPEIVRQIYAKRGIERLYPWQTECLSNDNVLLRGRNLVYSVPTSGGKTLPAEIHLMRMVVLKEKKALLVLPFVSIVLEKARSMSAFGKELRFPIEPYYGSNGPIPAPPGKSLSICTIEKANLLINQMIEDKCLDEIGLVVVDELHMVGEPDRGAVLELLLAKVMHAGKGMIQVIGMSATTGDSLAELGRWLNAEVFTRPFRPVDLHEHYVIGNDIFNTKKQLVRKLTNAKANSVDDVLLHLVKEVVPNSCVLLFCCTKKETQDVAERLAAQLPEVETHKAEEKRRLLEHIAAELGTDIDKIDRTLSKTIVRGVAFHHSGLSSIERELIETAFLKKEICVLTCTSTLAAGVNLPAQRVILRGAKTGQVPLTVRKYMQMVGRAGRAGMESLGESFLCLEQRDKNFVNLLVGQPPESLVSSLKSPMKRGEPHEQKQHEEDMFQRLVSDGLCGGYISTRHEVESFMRCTLGWQQGATEIQKKAEDALERLAAADLQFVTAAPDEKSEDALEPSLLYVPTPLAKATYRSNFAPRDSRLIYDELRSALNSITLADPLHRLYLITPLYALPEPVWTILPSLVEKMDPLRKKAVKRIGISMDWLNIKQAEAAMGAKPKRDPNSLMQELRARRLWSAWILSLVLEKDHDIDAVIAEYVRVWRKLDRSFDPSKTDIKVDRGVVEMLVESASGFGHSLAGLCKRYSAETKTSPNEADRRLSPVWGELETLLLRLSKQLNHGVKEEELELVEIHGVKKARAHKLFAAGYRTVHSIARAKVEEMTTRVKFGPYADGIAKRIIDAAKALLLAKATAMKEQAAELLEASDLVPGEEVDAQMV